MWEQEITIPTYRTGEPEKDPIFYSGRSYQGAKGPVYPYPLLDKLSDVKEDRKYRAVLLENPYVQFSILPELGGRVFSGQDRGNGYDFLYRQHVIKPALIGMVGPGSPAASSGTSRTTTGPRPSCPSPTAWWRIPTAARPFGWARSSAGSG